MTQLLGSIEKTKDHVPTKDKFSVKIIDLSNGLNNDAKDQKTTSNVFQNKLSENDNNKLCIFPMEKTETPITSQKRQRPPNYWSQERVDKTIKWMHKRNMPLDHKTIKGKYQQLLSAAKRVYKSSWSNILAQNNIDISKGKRKPGGYWTDKKILSEIKSLHKKGECLIDKCARNSHGDLWNGARRRFGNWKKALEVAGLNYCNIQTVKRYNTYKLELTDRVNRVLADKKSTKNNYLALLREINKQHKTLFAFFEERKINKKVQETLCSKIFDLFITAMLKYKHTNGRFPAREKNSPVFEADYNLDYFLSVMRKKDFNKIVALKKEAYLAFDPYNGKRVLSYWESNKNEEKIFIEMWDNNINVTRALAYYFLQNKTTIYNNRKLEASNKKTCQYDKDVIQELKIGMLCALRNYEWWRTTGKFSSFCTVYMRNQVLEYLKSIKKDSLNVSLDAPISRNDNDGNTRKDLLPDKTPSKGIIYKINTKMLIKAINELDEEKQHVITQFFGIGCNKQKLEVIGKRMGITRSRAQVIKDDVLELLKKKINLKEKFASYPVLTDDIV